MEGYRVKEYGMPVKRYCQALDLKNNPELIAEYRKIHSREEAWPEIRAGIRSVEISISSIPTERIPARISGQAFSRLCIFRYSAISSGLFFKSNA